MKVKAVIALNVVHFLIYAVYADVKRYDNYTLYKVYPKGEKQINELTFLKNTGNEYDFWTDPVPNVVSVQIMISPSIKNEMENYFNDREIKFEVSIPDIQIAINNQKLNNYNKRNLKSMEWDAYYDLDSIYNWLDNLANIYSDHVSEIIGGESYEGRKIKGIKISHGEGKRAIFLEGGIHSREWISPATVNYIAYQLLASNDPEINAIAKEFDWFIFPVTNPDGYIYSFTTNRMWRKNRVPFTSGNFGVDLNRNWNSHWLVAGASADEAADNYAGPGPFSEIETRTLSTFIKTIGDKIDLYLSFHSFSQFLLLPYGNSTAGYGNYLDALNIGRRAMGALSVRYGTQYVTGNIAETIYEATGGSIDWVKDELNIPLVFCYELRDQGQFGFLLPSDQILPNNEETMDSVVDLIYQAKRFGYMNSSIRASVEYVCIVLAIMNILFV